MTYLQLLQALHREAGLAGSAPSSVTGTTGMPQKLANWIAAAWIEIQSARKWSFLLTEQDVSLTVGKRDYEVVADLGLTDVREFDQAFAASMLPDGSDLGRLRWQSWQAFREQYGLAAVVPARPSKVTPMLPTKLRFDTEPDQAYKVRLAYYMTAEQLANNTDTPSLTEEEQWVIVWRALMFYAAHEGAADVYGDAQVKYQSAFSLLTQRYLPQIGFGAPLA